MMKVMSTKNVTDCEVQDAGPPRGRVPRTITTVMATTALATALRTAKLRRAALVLVGVVAVLMSSLVLGNAPAQADDTVATNCSGNAYVSEVQIQDYSLGQFEIKTTPTQAARYAAWNNDIDNATNEIWHAVQACVPGLYDTLADGIYEQIKCHVIGSLSGPLDAGGETYDFESWRQPVDMDVAVYSECNWGGWPYEQVGTPYRTDQLGNTPTF